MADKKQAAAPVQQIYCGPSLPHQYGLFQYQVFADGIPDHLVQVVEDNPAVKALIVPVENLAAVRLALAKPGSAEAAQFQEIRQTFAKGAK